MRELVIGPVRYAAERAFIPLIEEIAGTGDDSGIFFAHLTSLVILEQERVWVYSFNGESDLTDLLTSVPGLEQAIEEARKSI